EYNNNVNLTVFTVRTATDLYEFSFQGHVILLVSQRLNSKRPAIVFFISIFCQAIVLIACIAYLYCKISNRKRIKYIIPIYPVTKFALHHSSLSLHQLYKQIPFHPTKS